MLSVAPDGFLSVQRKIIRLQLGHPVISVFREWMIYFRYSFYQRSGSRLRPVQTFAAAEPDRFLVQLGRARASCRHEAPLVIFKGKGAYSREMEDILAGR